MPGDRCRWKGRRQTTLWANARRRSHAARLLANAPRPSLSASDGSSSRAARRVACVETAPHPLAPNEYEIVIGFMSALSKLQML